MKIGHRKDFLKLTFRVLAPRNFFRSEATDFPYIAKLILKEVFGRQKRMISLMRKGGEMWAKFIRMWADFTFRG